MHARWIQAVPLWAAVLACFGCTVWGQHPPRAWSDATGGESLERVFWGEVKAKHWTELEHHLAPTFVSLTPEGSLDRAATLARLQQLELKEYLLGDFEVRPGGQNVIVTYTLSLRGTLAGRPLPDTPARIMAVWQQTRQGWMAIAQATVVPAASR